MNNWSRRSRWAQLSPRTRKLVVAGAAIEGTLKIAALIDMARRPAGQIRGPKAIWAIGTTVISSGGIIPVAYFAFGRKGAS